MIDGTSDPAWDLAPWSSDFVDIEGVKIPEYRTRMKMLWDSTYLYFFAELEEPHVWADITKRDAVIFYNNDFEIFIDPDGDTHNYMEFEMNALNTVWDLFLTKPYRNDPKVVDSWDITGLKTAVSVNGILNNPETADKGWSVEVAMPWTSLTEAATTDALPVHSFWRINFSRVNWEYELTGGKYDRKQDTAGKYLPEKNWVWSPQEVINMHEPERWGYVYFATSVTDFQLPVDEPLKWELYSIYREIRERTDILQLVEVGSVEMNGKLLPVLLKHHLAGWNLSLTSPFSGNTYVIKEDGELITPGGNRK